MMSYAYGLEKENVRCRVNIAGNNSNSTLSRYCHYRSDSKPSCIARYTKVITVILQLRFELLIKNS